MSGLPKAVVSGTRKAVRVSTRSIVWLSSKTAQIGSRLAASAWRLPGQYLKPLRSDKRSLVVHIAVAATILMIVLLIAGWWHFGLKSAEMTVVGTYLSGAGQITVLIWIMATFYLQRMELSDQRAETELQRLAQQQQIVFLIFEHHRSQLERLAQDLVELSVSSELLAEIHRQRATHSTIDYFSVLLGQNKEVQNQALQKLDERDTMVILCVEDIIRRYEVMRDAVAKVDYSGLLHQTLLAGTPLSAMYYILSAIHRPTDR